MRKNINDKAKEIGGQQIRLLFLLFAIAGFFSGTQTARAISPDIVIGQIYGGGGNSGAPFTNDFVELFNRGNTAVSLTGWSIQYASATGAGNFNSNPVTLLAGTLSPGQYYLVQFASGGANGVALPTPDAIGTVNMSGTGGKVIVSNSSVGLACNGGATVCNASQLAAIVDLVGWDGANFFETSPAPPTSNSTAVLRGGGGCTETDNNAADFTAVTPNPRNTASPLFPCTLSTDPTGAGTADPDPVTVSGSTLLAVTVVPGTNPTSTGLAVAGDLSGIGGSATQVFFDDGSNGDVKAGDSVFSFLAAIPGATSGGVKTLPISITDAQGRSGVAAISLTVEVATPAGGDVVISQVYGGGGNSGATLTHDFIELYNRSNSAVNITGWSVQYSASGGTTWQVTSLSGSLASGSIT